MWHWPYRCRDCGQRRTLRKKLEKYDYRRQPRCYNPECRRARKGKGGVLVLDRWMKFTERGKRRMDVCNCGGYLFFHRKGSKHCRHSKVYNRVGDFGERSQREQEEAA